MKVRKGFQSSSEKRPKIKSSGQSQPVTKLPVNELQNYLVLAVI